MGRTLCGIKGGVVCLLGLVLAGSMGSCGGADGSRANNGGNSGSGGAPDAPLGGSAGTGGSVSDAPVPGVREACMAWCDKTAQAGCSGGTPQEQCPDACESLLFQIDCAKEYAATGDCIAREARFRCLSDGNVEMYGCWTEVQPYAVCATCAPLADDDACDTCTKTECCAERKAYIGHPDLGPFTDCVEGCTDQDAGTACVQACATNFPNLQAVSKSLADCIGTCLPRCG